MATKRDSPVGALSRTKVWFLATAGVEEAIRASVGRACDAPDTRYAVRWNVHSVAELMRSSAALPADILLLDRNWVADSLHSVLAEVHGIAPETRVLLIGECLDVAATARALNAGLRGCLTPCRAESDLLQALHTIANDQVWLSRSMTCALLDLRSPVPDTTTDDTWRNLPALSQREFAVVHEVLQGLTNKQIARVLGISEQTVKIHLQSIYRKLRVHRRMDLVLLHDTVPRG
jgi:DNA-binding NarL/FixJ family response regulator